MARSPREPLTRLQKMRRSDGALCVTFVNTASAKRRALETYGDLVAWGVETGALSAPDGSRLLDAAAEHPGAAGGVVRRARTLIRRLERIFVALAAGRRPAAADFEALNAELRRVMSARQLVATHGGYQWSWGELDGEDLDRMLWPVVLSAGNLLVTGDRERVRQCGEGCGLWFIARGAGRPRKWCGVTCRNRASSKTHYHRKIKPKRAGRKRTKDTANKTRLVGYDKPRKPGKK